MVNKYTISQKVYGDAILNEAPASVLVKPGYLVERVVVSGVNTVKPHATAKGYAEPLVAIEDSMLGKTVRDDYAIGDNVKFIEGRNGDEMYMVLKASEKVAINDILSSAGDGTLQKTAASADCGLFKALEASDTTTAVRILVKVINPKFVAGA